MQETHIGRAANIGPWTYLRPGNELGEGSKAGAFVEMKKAHIGNGTKVPHLSYVGDAQLGDHTNIGGGTITANGLRSGLRENHRSRRFPAKRDFSSIIETCLPENHAEGTFWYAPSQQSEYDGRQAINRKDNRQIGERHAQKRRTRP